MNEVSTPKPKASKRQRAALRKAFEKWLATAEEDGVFEPPSNLVGGSKRREAKDHLADVLTQAIRELSVAMNEKGAEQRAKQTPLRVVQEAVQEISILRTRVVARTAEAARLRELNGGLVDNGARLARELEEVTRELARAHALLRTRPTPGEAP